MQIITIAGRIGRDAETNSPNGKPVCNFSVAVDQGFGNNKSTNWFRCALWGQRGEKLAQYLTKGSSVTVVGTLRIGEYQGKPQYDVDVSEVALQGGRSEGGNQSGGQPYNDQRNDPPADDSLNDDVPW
ncbi:single-stranded DNA-binding protein [Pacificimonas sp. ICDLI1SI03]